MLDAGFLILDSDVASLLYTSISGMFNKALLHLCVNLAKIDGISMEIRVIFL